MNSIYEYPWSLPVGPDRLEEIPDLCVNVLAWCGRKGVTSKIIRERPPWYERRCLLQAGWIESVRPLTKKRAKRLQEETDDPMDKALIEYAAGKRGPPIILRRPAIMAYVLCKYFHKKLIQVTAQVCPCGLEHTPDRVRTQCYPRLRPIVGQLDRLLKECKITLPKVPEVEIWIAQPLPLEAFLRKGINKTGEQERRTKLVEAITKANNTKSAQGAAFRELKASGKKLEDARKALEDAKAEAERTIEEHYQAIEELSKILNED